MSHLEEIQGLEPGQYSPAFLALDAVSGPWLVRSQQESAVARGGHERFDVDLERATIEFGDGDRIGVAARFEVIGTHSPGDGTWLWAWSNPAVQHLGHASEEVRDRHEDVDEFQQPALACTEVMAWSLAAAMAHEMGAESCYRIPGDVHTFVALFDVVVLSPDDERGSRLRPDPDAAAGALSEYAGPAALRIGGLLLDSLREGAPPMEEVIRTIHSFCDSLDELARSPLGRDTPAAEQAGHIAGVMRHGALLLTAPPDSDALRAGGRDVLAALREVARAMGTWPDEDEEPR